ncbi:MAG: VWA domain-containing protein [Acidobacteriota bacterium]|nr:VWA domain-containing protein [Acidobacteriota bacterium]
MFKSKNFTILVIGLLFGSVSLIGFDVTSAQTNQNPQTVNTTATASPAATPPIEEDSEVIKIDTELVNVLFTAQDKNRRLLTDLKQSDIKLIEDGQPQNIVSFTRQVDLPLSLAILIDTSVSQERTLPEEKAAAKSFIESVIRPAKDEVSIISFTGETTLEQGMTNNIARLGRAIDRVQFVPPANYIGGGVITGGTTAISGDTSAVSTAIWDAIWVTSDEVLKPSPDKTRRAIILLTDGDDTYSRKKINEAVDKALKAEAVIYCIGIGDPFMTTKYRNGINEISLQQLSNQTGGRAFFPRDEAELHSAFVQIQIEMRSQYLIAYEPLNQKNDGSYRKIDIQLTNPELVKQKILLTHRQGYFGKTEVAKPKK